MNEEEIERQIETGTQLLVEAMGYLLKDYEGIVIHMEGMGFALWKNPEEGRIEVYQDDEYLTIESGRMIWMHDENSTAPAPAEGDEVFGDIPVKVDPKKLN